MSDLDRLCAAVAAGNGSVDRELLSRAWAYAEAAHDGFSRLSGGPYFAHSREVAEILADWRAPSEIVAAGLLHDVVKTTYSRRPDRESLRASFGEEIESLVAATAMLGRFGGTMVARALDEEDGTPSELAETGFDETRVSIAAVEVRRSPLGVVVKLADRQQNLRNLEKLDPERRETFLSAINSIFTPLAYKLGMRRVAELLQTEAMRIQEPQSYEACARDLRKSRGRERLQPWRDRVGAALAHAGIEAELRIREPAVRDVHLHSLDRSTAPNSIATLYSLDVTVPSHEDCYRALGALHRDYTAHDGFSDTLSTRLEDGERRPTSRERLLTTRISDGSTTAMIRIAARDYWLVNDLGITAEWHGVDPALLPHIEDLPARPEGHIMLLTPKGDVIYMPEGVTVLDFAFAVHMSIGYRFQRATVNGMPADQGHRLSDGDVVNILTSPIPTMPDPDWEQHVTTDRARQALRQLSRRRQQVELIVDAKDYPGLVYDIASICRKFSLSVPYLHAAATTDGKAAVRFAVTSVDDYEVEQLRTALREKIFILDVYRTDSPEHQKRARRLMEAPLGEGGPFGEGPASGSTFVGRRKELDDIRRALRNQGRDSAVLIWGQRRVGKTSLLQELYRKYLRSDAYLPVLIDLAPQLDGPTSTSTGDFLYELAEKISVAVVHSELTVGRKGRWMQDPLQNFRRFLDRLARVGGTQSVLVIVDEFDALRHLREDGPSQSQVFLTLRSLVQHSDVVNFVFCGGGILPELQQRSHITSLISTIASIEIDHFSEADAEEMLVRPRSEAEFADGAIKRLIGATRGHPYYLQHIGRRLVTDYRPGDPPLRIGEIEVEAAIEAFLRDSATAQSSFDHYWKVGREFVSDSDTRDALRLATLAVIAQMESERRDATLGTLLRHLGRWVPEEAVDTAISDLRAYRSIEDHGGYLHVRLPLFESWLRANYPKERVPVMLKGRYS